MFNSVQHNYMGRFYSCVLLCFLFRIFCLQINLLLLCVSVRVMMSAPSAPSAPSPPIDPNPPNLLHAHTHTQLHAHTGVQVSSKPVASTSTNSDSSSHTSAPLPHHQHQQQNQTNGAKDTTATTTSSQTQEPEEDTTTTPLMYLDSLSKTHCDVWKRSGDKEHFFFSSTRNTYTFTTRHAHRRDTHRQTCTRLQRYERRFHEQ